MNSNKLVVMIEIAIMAALAYVFSMIKFGWLWPQGGSVSLVMIPILIIAFRRGWIAGVIVGLIVGIVKLILGGYVVHPIQLLLDYPVAYAVVGLAGLFIFKQTHSMSKKITLVISGIVVGASLRLLSHFTSGVVWFGEYAPEGTPVAIYSFTYNFSYLAPEALISLVIVAALVKISPQLFQANSVRF
jgi:thiamine transporter